MPIIRLIIAGVVVVFGLLITFVVAVVGLVLFAVQRIFGASGSSASFKINIQRGPNTPKSSRPTRMARDGAIDIEATEIKDTSPPKQRLEG